MILIIYSYFFLMFNTVQTAQRFHVNDAALGVRCFCANVPVRSRHEQ